MSSIKIILILILLISFGCQPISKDTNQYIDTKYNLDNISKPIYYKDNMNEEFNQKKDINYMYEYVSSLNSINALATDIKSGDINSDGLIDIIIAISNTSTLDFLEHSHSQKEGLTQDKESIGNNEIIIYINKGSWNFNAIHIPIKEMIGSPGELSIKDFDSDGDLDIIVGIMGKLKPTKEKNLGGVIIIENKLNKTYQSFKSHVIARKLPRVVKVLAKDIDKDNDQDLIIAAFGSEGQTPGEGDGKIYLLKNNNEWWNFEKSILSDIEGSLDIVDISSIVNNEYPIIAVLISENYEKIISFNFKEISNISQKEIYSINNTEWGSLRLEFSDLDKDGDNDLIWINGDPPEDPKMNGIHGINWIEQENGKFNKLHKIGRLPGVFNGIPIDYDNDNDIDIITSQSFINLDEKGKTYIGSYKNEGNGTFSDYEILAKDQAIAMVMSVGDYDNDGDFDIIYQDITSLNITILENKLI